VALPDESTPRTGTLETEETETSLRFTFLPDPDSLRRSHIKEPVEQILLAEVDRQAARVRIYPIVPFWDNDRYLKPKYAQVQCFELPIDDVDLDYIADFTALTERFPRGFVQDYQFGLGLGKPYRPIVTNGKADYWTYIQEAIWSMSSDDEDQQGYLKSSSLVSP